MKLVIYRWVAFALVASSSLITGCATKFEKQAFNSEAAAGLKKITVSQWNDQEEYRAVIINHPGGSFGLIGAIVAAADTSSKSKKLTDALDPKATKTTSVFYEQAFAGLKQSGYEITPVPAKRGEKYDVVKASISKPQGQDASLALNVEASYFAAGASTGYYPSVTMFAELTDAKSQAILYRESYNYGYNFGKTDIVQVEAPVECKFSDIAALTENVEKTRMCLLTGIDLLAKQLLSDLKK